MPIWIQSGPAAFTPASTGVGKTTGSVWAAATSSGFKATSVAPIGSPNLFVSVLAVAASPTYHWKLKNRSLAAFSRRSRYDLGSSVTVG